MRNVKVKSGSDIELDCLLIDGLVYVKLNDIKPSQVESINEQIANLPSLNDEAGANIARQSINTRIEENARLIAEKSERLKDVASQIKQAKAAKKEAKTEHEIAGFDVELNRLVQEQKTLKAENDKLQSEAENLNAQLESNEIKEPVIIID